MSTRGDYSADERAYWRKVALGARVLEILAVDRTHMWPQDRGERVRGEIEAAARSLGLLEEEEKNS
jgi:hypothetical protein